MALCLFIANTVYYAYKLPNIEIVAISKILAHKSWFFKFLKKRYGIKFITFMIMKQKTRFENFGNIGYHPTNERYIGIGLKKAISVYL